jgi:tRNA pseudouridine55 synthase
MRVAVFKDAPALRMVSSIVLTGAIVVDKPEGITSHDVVNRVRRLANTKKVGHLGTLDPMATGVLPLLIGRATRLAQFFSGGEKTYITEVQFGWSTDTYDREGERASEPVEPRFTRDELESAMARYRGSFLQTPPPFSAKKIAGTPAYKLARKGKPVDLMPVEVHVLALDLLGFDGSSARMLVRCSAGTYVRSIAHDLGQGLGCGAFLTALRRTASGDFTEPMAATLQALAADFAASLIPAARLLPEFPSATVDDLTIAQIRQGKDFRMSPFVPWAGAKYVKAVSADGDLIAIGEARLPHVYHPVCVL